MAPDNRNASSWGWFTLSSLLLWLIILIAGFWARPVDREVLGVWFAGCTGGISTAQYLLSSLFRRKVAKQEFTQRYAIICVVQPILGFIAGAAIYATGIIFSLLLNNELLLTEVWVQAALHLLSWIVGYQIIGKNIFERFTK